MVEQSAVAGGGGVVVGGIVYLGVILALGVKEVQQVLLGVRRKLGG